jgi:hypothetical protein
MNEQRQQALYEQRQRIINAAKSMYGATVSYEHVDVTVLIQDSKQIETSLDLATIKQTLSDYLSKGITDGKDFEQIIDEIFNEIGAVYPERDIEVVVRDNVDNYTVMKIFNTTKPYQQLAI